MAHVDDRPQIPPDRDNWDLRTIKAHVDVKIEDGARFEELANRWIGEPRTRLFGELVRRARDGKEWVSAAIGRVPPLMGGAKTVAFSESSFDALLTSLSSRGERATWLVDDLSLDILRGECTAARVEFDVFEESPEWVEFEVTMSYRVGDDRLIPASAQRDLIEFVASFSDEAAPAFGNIAADNSGALTALEAVLHRRRGDALAQADTSLRGYSWVTVCPAPLVERLGGLSALQSSGAFVEVRSLRQGGALLQATETFEGYDDEAVMRVFKTLAPVLPAGLPQKPSGLSTRRRMRLIYEDASTYR